MRGGDDDAEVLLQLRGATGYMEDHWAAAAAGHVERGETALDAVRREALEEIGVEVADPVFELSMQRTQRGRAIDERIDFFFTARAWTGEPTVLEPVKCRELRWCRLDDLPEPMVPHERLALAALGTGTRHLSVGFDDDGASTTTTPIPDGGDR